MATQIRTWQIVDGKLRSVDTTLADNGRRETDDLESWIAAEPSILGPDIALIGRQVMTQSGPLDLLGIDKAGNIVVVELKRDRLPREVLAQAIDYASDIATWSAERLSEECVKYTTKSLSDLFTDTFEDVGLENLTINESQRILLVGFGAESSLERMIEWLSDNYGVDVNAIVLQYARTVGGEELLTKTAIMSEAEERARSKGRKFTIAMSDEPGQYGETELRERLYDYLSSNLWSSRRIREILLPACLEQGRVTREQLVQEFLKRGAADDAAMAGRFVSLISLQLGMAKNGFLRQAIGYEYPEFPWQKDNYQIRDGYRDLIKGLLTELKPQKS
jgi:hypothetical protein